MTFTLQDHVQKAELILNNERHLYEREQAIFKVYLLTGEHENFTRQLIDLAQKVVIWTNIVESSDQYMHGKTFDMVQAEIYKYMVAEYHDEYVEWHQVINVNKREVVNK